jgi:hypothetical protein
MPFTVNNKSAGDLIRSQDWNAAMAGIAALFDRLNAATGHGHTGTLEDGPQIGTAGIADFAVTLQQLADLAVSTSKIVDGAVTTDKIADLSVTKSKIGAEEVTTPKLTDNCVTTIKLADNSVTSSKIVNGSVTAAKLAAGTVAEFGFAAAILTDGQTAPLPAGFLRSECIYHWGFKFLVADFTAPTAYNLNSIVDPLTGLVSVGNGGLFGNPFTFNNDFWGYVNVLTIAKKGGW